MSIPPEMVGYIAAFLTTTSYIPQARMVWRTDNTSGISLGMYFMMVSGVALWMTYGILLGDAPLMVANAITLSMSSYILFRKIKHVRAGDK